MLNFHFEFGGNLKSSLSSHYPYPFAYNATLIGSDNKTLFYTPRKNGIKYFKINNNGKGTDYYISTFYKTSSYRIIAVRGAINKIFDIYLEYSVSGTYSGEEIIHVENSKYGISVDAIIDWDKVNAGYGQNLTLERARIDTACIENIPSAFNGRLIIVDSNGTGHYTTIQDAVNAANDGDIVYIHSGWYEESVVYTKQIALIGQDKESTVLFNTTGEYATPPLWTCSGRIENLTVYAYNKENKSFDDISKLGYAFHLDQKWDPVHSRRHIEIRNCIFKSDFNDAIGCGIEEVE